MLGRAVASLSFVLGSRPTKAEEQAGIPRFFGVILMAGYSYPAAVFFIFCISPRIPEIKIPFSFVFLFLFVVLPF
jgi:hypothetical protein